MCKCKKCKEKNKYKQDKCKCKKCKPIPFPHVPPKPPKPPVPPPVPPPPVLPIRRTIDDSTYKNATLTTSIPLIKQSSINNGGIASNQLINRAYPYVESAVKTNNYQILTDWFNRIPYKNLDLAVYSQNENGQFVLTWKSNQFVELSKNDLTLLLNIATPSSNFTEFGTQITYNNNVKNVYASSEYLYTSTNTAQNTLLVAETDSDSTYSTTTDDVIVKYILPYLPFNINNVSKTYINDTGQKISDILTSLDPLICYALEYNYYNYLTNEINSLISSGTLPSEFILALYILRDSDWSEYYSNVNGYNLDSKYITRASQLNSSTPSSNVVNTYFVSEVKGDPSFYLYTACQYSNINILLREGPSTVIEQFLIIVEYPLQ
jgi:hypothetical protein